MSIEVPDELRILSADLPEKWQNSMEATRRIGTRFITDQTVPLLRIPSIVMPQASNYLLNPNHPDAASIRIVETWRYPFDSRLLS